MRLWKVVAIASVALFGLAQGDFAISGDTPTAKETKEDFKDIGRAVKKDSQAAGRELKNGFNEMKGTFTGKKKNRKKAK